MATEKRLIDANKVRDKAIPLEGLDGDGIPYAIMAVPADAIDDAPTVDAVEVVRCKDCVHRHTRGSCHGRPLDWYCPDGIRRNDGVAEK